MKRRFGNDSSNIVQEGQILMTYLKTIHKEKQVIYAWLSIK